MSLAIYLQQVIPLTDITTEKIFNAKGSLITYINDDGDSPLLCYNDKIIREITTLYEEDIEKITLCNDLYSYTYLIKNYKKIHLSDYTCCLPPLLNTVINRGIINITKKSIGGRIYLYDFKNLFLEQQIVTSKEIFKSHIDTMFNKKPRFISHREFNEDKDFFNDLLYNFINGETYIEYSI